MSRYSPSDVLRKFVLRKCIEHIVVTSEHAVWFNLTFWENVTSKPFASKCWNKLQTAIVREYPSFRLVGVWARQRRGAWHIHAVCNQRFDIEWLRSKAMRCGFGPRFHLQEIDQNPVSPQKIARYISGYCTDKNGLDPEKDKGVRRTIFVGKHVRVIDMRYRSQLKMITSAGREQALDMERTERAALSDFERDYSTSGRKKPFETWGEWYRRNRDLWFQMEWSQYTVEQQDEIVQLDEHVLRYLTTGQWSYV